MRAVLTIMFIFLVASTATAYLADCNGCRVLGDCVCGRAFWLTITEGLCVKRDCRWIHNRWRVVGSFIDCTNIIATLTEQTSGAICWC
ncbi:uncharacterized protein LOC128250447 isoform X3 [Octopus bimaculoides]|uniref:uncharacterized protein LOC128250447 isoform X3 n=1 Tax=Octopus bimaculoides TaxID=37653 RepID=UPI0022E01EE5|nr:uncharacterized protein LOC128250447 isoform X3 [Octopus bimaculoides]